MRKCKLGWPFFVCFSSPNTPADEHVWAGPIAILSVHHMVAAKHIFPGASPSSLTKKKTLPSPSPYPLAAPASADSALISPQESVCYPGPRDLLLLHLLQGERQHRCVAFGKLLALYQEWPCRREKRGEGYFRCGSIGLWKVPALPLVFSPGVQRAARRPSSELCLSSMFQEEPPTHSCTSEIIIG